MLSNIHFEIFKLSHNYSDKNICEAKIEGELTLPKQLENEIRQPQNPLLLKQNIVKWVSQVQRS